MGRFFTVLSLIGVLLWTSPAFSEVLDRIVAFVNNDIISLQDLERESRGVVERIRNANQGSDTRVQVFQAKHEVLEQMIDKLLVKEEVERLGIKITEDEVDRAVERIKQDNSLNKEQLIARLEREGSSLEELREQVREEIQRARLLDREVRARVVITDEQLRQYYDANKDEFMGKNRLRLKIILLPVSHEDTSEKVKATRALADRLAQEIHNGKSFEELARIHSQGPNAAGGGDLGYLKWEDLAPYLKKAIAGLKAGDVSDVIESPYGFQLVKVVEKETTGVKSFEDVKEQIRAQLYREQLNKRYQSWVAGLREKAYVKINF